MHSFARGRGCCVDHPRVEAAPLFALMLMVLPLPAPALDTYTGFEANYQTGDFDTATDESLYSLSAAIGVVGDRADGSVTVPFITVDSDDNGSDSGMGDVILRAGYIFFEPSGGGTSLRGSVALKLPTADEQDGLGTGETDLGGFVTLSHKIARDQFSVTVGYIATGNDRRQRDGNLYTYGFSIARKFDATQGVLSIEGRDSTDDDIETVLEVHASAFHVLDGYNMLTGGFSLGLTDEAPDRGVAFGFIHWF